MKCPGSGGDCFDVDCLTGGCQGYDVRMEAVTVVHTVITNRRGRRAAASLTVATPGPIRLGGEGDTIKHGGE